MPHLYGHKYLGPGSSLDRLEEPLDIDDFYALIHDFAYEVANNREDIREADRRAILNFLGDFISDSNWHSLLGAAGLATKYGIESVVGVLYPQVAHDMPPVKNWAKIRRIQAAINAKLEAEGKPAKFSWKKQTGAVSKKGKANVDTPRKQSRPTTTTENPFEGNNSHWAKQIEEPPPAKKQKENPIDDLDQLDRLLDAVNQEHQSTEPGVSTDSGVVPGTSGQQQVGSSTGAVAATSNMDTMDIDGEANNPSGNNTRTVSANSGGSASASGGAGQNQSYIRGPYQSISTGRFSLSKRFRFRAYGYAWGNSAVSALDGDGTARTFANGLNTSLAFIPTDYLPMYMNQAEWTTFGTSRRINVEYCSLSIIPAGYNVSFDTASTLSGAASATHFVEAKYAKGINTTFPCRAVKYTSSAATPMNIASIAQIAKDDIVKVLYTEPFSQSNVQGNSWPWYVQFIQPSSTMDYTYYNKDDLGEWNDPGALNISSHMTVGALQGMLNNPISLNFTPKLGIIFNQFQNPGFPLNGTKWQDQNQWFTNPNEILTLGEYDATTKKRKHVMTTRAQTRHAISVNPTSTTDAVNEPFVWQQRIDKSGQMGWLCGEGPTRAQVPPVLMFGISPVKVSLPSAAADSFVQSHVDFYVETHMEITVNNSGIGTLWPLGNFKDCLYGAQYTNQTTSYGELHTFGLINTVTGTASNKKQSEYTCVLFIE